MAERVRRTILALIAVLVFAAPGLALAEDRVGTREISLGAPTAPVTLIEYGSVTCPHCARFNADILPVLKAKYIDTGKVKYVFREVPIHEQEDTAGFLIARCAGPDKYLTVVDALMRAQPILFEKRDFKGWLMAGATAGGLDEPQMRACITDAAAILAFNERAEHTLRTDKIDSTPTVFANGKMVKVSGPEISVADVEAAIQPLLRGRSGSARRVARPPVH